MRDLAEVLEGVPLLLERIARVGHADHLDLARLELDPLPLRGRFPKRAERAHRAPGAQLLEGLEARHVAADDDLERIESGAVVQRDEDDVFRRPHGARPALHPAALPGQLAQLGAQEWSDAFTR